MLNWIDVEEMLPEMDRDEITHEFLLFVSGGTVKSGHYHANGCFYSLTGNAKTHFAESKYGDTQLPKEYATHWMPYSEIPLPGGVSCEN